MNFHKRSTQEMRNIGLLEFTQDWAVKLGMDLSHTNHSNIKLKLEKALTDSMAFEAKAKELGYSSLGLALKALAQIKKHEQDLDLSGLPEVLHKPPHSWINGVTQNQKKGRAGLVGLGIREAERRHRMIVPLLLEAWELTQPDNYDVQKEILIQYRTSSHKEFEALLYTYIHNLEPLTLEEEFEEAAESVLVPVPYSYTNEDPDLEALVWVRITDAQAYGREVDIPKFEKEAIRDLGL